MSGGVIIPLPMSERTDENLRGIVRVARKHFANGHRPSWLVIDHDKALAEAERRGLDLGATP